MADWKKANVSYDGSEEAYAMFDASPEGVDHALTAARAILEKEYPDVSEVVVVLSRNVLGMQVNGMGAWPMVDGDFEQARNILTMLFETVWAFAEAHFTDAEHVIRGLTDIKAAHEDG